MMPPRRPSSLPRWQEAAVYAGVGTLLLTGLAWLVLDRGVRIAGEFGPEHHPAEHWLLVAHAIGAYAFLVIIGAMIPVHIPLGWHRRRNRLSGAVTLALFALLSLTALALYDLGDDAARSWASVIHWTVGIAALPVILVHVTRNRTAR